VCVCVCVCVCCVVCVCVLEIGPLLKHTASISGELEPTVN